MKKENWYREQTHLICYECNCLLPKDSFYTDESRLTGYRPYCKACDNKIRVNRERKRREEKNG